MPINCKSDQELRKKECYKCITKCKPNQERNPKTGRCILKKKDKSTTKKRVYKKKTISSLTRSRSMSRSRSPTPLLSTLTQTPTPVLDPSSHPFADDVSPSIIFRFKNKFYKLNKEDAVNKSIVIKNKGKEKVKNIEIYNYIYDMNMENIVFTTTDEENGNDIYFLFVFHMDKEFYFVDEDKYIYNDDGQEIGQYNEASGNRRSKGNMGLGKRRENDYVEFN